MTREELEKRYENYLVTVYGFKDNGHLDKATGSIILFKGSRILITTSHQFIENLRRCKIVSKNNKAEFEPTQYAELKHRDYHDLSYLHFPKEDKQLDQFINKTGLQLIETDLKNEPEKEREYCFLGQYYEANNIVATYTPKLKYKQVLGTTFAFEQLEGKLDQDFKSFSGSPIFDFEGNMVSLFEGRHDQKNGSTLSGVMITDYKNEFLL